MESLVTQKQTESLVDTGQCTTFPSSHHKLPLCLLLNCLLIWINFVWYCCFSFSEGRSWKKQLLFIVITIITTIFFCYYYHMKYEESPRQMLLRLKPAGYKRFLDSERGKDSLACQFDDICRTPFGVNVNNCFRATWFRRWPPHLS